MPTSAELPTVVSPDTEVAGSPPSQRHHARQQTHQTQTSALPPLDGRAASPEHGGVDIETKRLRAGIVPSLTEMERLRNIIYEKNRDIFQLKQEITVLKQIERRQQRDLDHLQHDEDEAPRIIRMMREEAQGLKALSAQRNADDRAMRQYMEKIQHLTERCEQYRLLVEEQQLGQREDLAKAVETEKQRSGTMQATIDELQRKIDLSTKNYHAEYRSLKQRIQVAETDAEDLRNQLQETETLLKEKEKALGSLSIYRYKMVHGVEAECRICKQREKEEQQRRRHAELMAKIPVLDAPQLSAQSATSMQVTVALPPLSDHCQYNDVKVSYWATNDATTRREVMLDKKSLPQEPSEKPTTATITVVDLIAGNAYCAMAVAMQGTNESKPSQESASATVDALPNAPPAPTDAIKMDARSISVAICPSDHNSGSAVSALRVYHADSPAKLEGEPSSSEYVGQVIPGAEFTLTSARLASFHYFQVAAVNLAGEGPRSKWSEAFYLDQLPATLPQPRVIKVDPTSLMITVVPSAADADDGSPITSFRISFGTAAGELQSIQVDDVNMLEQFVTDLDTATEYVIRVTARNLAGESDASEPLTVCLAEMLTPPNAPSLEAISPSIALVRISTSDELALGARPAGYKILYSRNADMINAKEVLATQQANLLPSVTRCKILTRKSKQADDELTCVVEGLDEGEEYFVGIKAIDAQGRETGMSSVVSVTLLPSSLKASHQNLSSSNRSSMLNLHRSLRDLATGTLRAKSKSALELSGSRDMPADGEKPRHKASDTPQYSTAAAGSRTSLADEKGSERGKVPRRPPLPGSDKHRFVSTDRKRPGRVGFESGKKSASAVESKE